MANLYFNADTCSAILQIHSNCDLHQTSFLKYGDRKHSGSDANSTTKTISYSFIRCTALFLCLLLLPSFLRATSALCITTPNSSFEYISSVTLNGVTKTGKASTSGPGYMDQTSSSIGNFEIGKTYTISITVVNTGNYVESVSAWFDFNGNNSLNDPGELVFHSQFVFNGTHIFTGIITIPEDAVYGERYIRVGLSNGNTPIPCDQQNIGGAIDFKINIVGSGVLTPKTLNGCLGTPGSKLTFTALFASIPGPYTFKYNINKGPDQTVTTVGNNNSVDVVVPTNIESTSIYYLVSVQANGLPLQSLNDSASVVIHPLPPSPTITSSGTTVCQGQGVILTSSEAYGYVWSNGSLTRSISVGQPGDFSVTIMDGYGCTSSSETFHQVAISYLEVPSVGGDRVICQGDSVILNVSGTGSNNFTWLPISGLNTITGATVIAKPLSSTTYTVTAPNDCSNTIYVLVNPKPISTITPSGSAILCPGASIDLSLPVDIFNQHKYQWSTGATTSSIHVSSPGFYTVMDTNGFGCVKSSSIKVTNGVYPLVTGGNNVNLCSGNSTTLNVTGATGYTWSPSYGLSSTTGASVIANPAVSTLYTITSTDPGNCSTNVSVNLNAPISIQASGPTSFCSGDSVLLSAGELGSGNAVELDGSSQLLITPNLKSDFQTNSVTIELWFKANREGVIVSELGQSFPNGPWHNSQVEIFASGLVKVRVWGLTPIAVGTASFNTWQHIVLRYDSSTGILNGWLNGVKSGASSSGERQAPVAQYWGFGAGDSQQLGSGGAFFKGQFDEIRIWNIARTDNEIEQKFNRLVPPNAAGLVAYYKLNESSGYTANDAAAYGNNGELFNTNSRVPSDLEFPGFLWSTGATTQSIKVKTSGTYTLSYSFFDGCASSANKVVTVLNKPIVSGKDTVDICIGSSTTLSVTGAAGYIWAPATGLNTTSGFIVIASPLVSTTYTVTSTGPGSCSTTIRVNVNSLPATPSINASGPTTFCKGDSVTLNATGGSNYLWSTGETTSSITVKHKGIFIVTSANASGCTATASKLVNVGDVPQVIGNNNNSPVCAGTPVKLTVTGADHYLWSSNVYLNQDSTIGMVSPLGTETYTIWAIDGIYCSTSITINVNPLPTPTISVSGPIAFCEGGSTQLSTETFSKYLWSNGGTTQTITATKDGNYTVTVTDVNGCSATSAPYHIPVLEAPALINIIASDTIICEGSSVVLTPTGGIQYFWAGAGDVGLTYTVSPVATTEYIVYGYNAIGCYKKDSITIHVNPSTMYYQDLDGDGFGNPDIHNTYCTLQSGWVIDYTDCDDADKDIHPGAAELCDGKDNDCDGQIDEDVSQVFYQDADNDGFGDASVSILACSRPLRYSANGSDCNDSDSTVHQQTMYYRDIDGDGFGGSSGQLFCLASSPAGYSSNHSDCNDQLNTIYPGAPELCDGYDNNCNGQIDEGLVKTLYRDFDGDGYGNPGFSIQSCSAVSGYVVNNSDCNDADINIHPGATEVCDGIDNNCDGKTDDVATAATYYPDKDGDGFGDSRNAGVTSCNSIPGSVTNNGDCNDNDRSIHQAVLYYVDNDHDGHGAQIGIMLCSSSAPGGFSTTNDDCDDFNAAVPAFLYIDADGDGYGTGNVIVYCSKDKPVGYSTNNTDCNDADPLAHQEVMYYVDADGDGFGGLTGQVFCLNNPPAGYSRYNSDCDDHNAAEQCCQFTAPTTFSQPPYSGNCYSLTSRQDQVGSIWGNEAISLNHDFSLDFNTSQTSGSQGMMFVLQAAGVYARGATSAPGSLGYYLSPDFLQSIGIELDNANSGAVFNDASSAHITVVQNGSPVPVTGAFNVGSTFSDVVKNFKVTWNHTTKILSVYLDGVLVLSYNNDLANNVFSGNSSVYFGFTSANEPSNDPKAKPAGQEFCVNSLVYDNELKIIQSDNLICNKGQLITNAVASCTFLWSTGATTSSIEITQSGLYSVTVTNAEGCVTTVSYNAIVTSGPVITASATRLCPGTSITLTSSIANSYLWNTNETTRSIVVNAPGEYNVSNGVCSASQSIVITSLTASIEASGSTNLCPGESVSLTASQGLTYHWSTGVTTREIIVNTTGTYTVNITYAEGCTLEASIDVTVGSLAKAHVYASNGGHPYNCNSPFVDLNQDTYPEYDQYTFSWYKVGVVEALLLDNPSSSLQVNQPGQFYLVVKRNDCTSDPSDSLNVIYDNGDPSVFGNNTWNVYAWQNGIPGPGNPQGGLVYKGYYTESNLSFDTRQKWTDFLSPSFVPDYHGCPVTQDFFQWSAKRKGFIPGIYNIRIPAYDQSAQLYIDGNLIWSDGCCSNSGDNIIWTGLLGIDSKVEFSVSEQVGPAFGAIQFELSGCVIPKPTITVNDSTDICEGGQITLTTQSGFAGYAWMNGENIIPDANTNSLQVGEAGNYTVKVNNGDTCISESSGPVIVTVKIIKTYYRDADGDGFGNPQISLQACVAPQGYITDHTDCDDSEISIHPGAIEICDGKDNNCDGNVDEGVSIPSTPTVNLIQPTCLLPTGTITITNKSAIDSASFNNGLSYQISNSKSGLSPGNYMIKVKTIRGCLSVALPVTINVNSSIPSTPTVSIIQPTCIVLTGSITVTNKAASDSISFNNGISFQHSDTKTGLAPGIYSIKIKTIAGCISGALSVTINPVPTLPNAPSISIIQPTCLNPLGSITINNKAVTDSASFDNGLSYQTSNVKSGLIPGTYVVRIKIIGGCISNSVNAIIDPLPNSPLTPIITITQPSCSILSGSIEVANKAKKDSVSFNNGLSYQISNNKTGLIPGNYQVLIKSVQGCVSGTVVASINLIPSVPITPIVSILQPSCLVPTGSITIMNKTILDSASFNNGKTYQISDIKSGLTPGTYLVLIKNNTACVSASLSVTINSLSSIPSTPNFSIVQPTCLNPTGTITINNKPATDSISFDNGLSYQISNVKQGLLPGTYSLRIKNSGGCVSNSINAVIDPVNNYPETPTLKITQPSCSVPTGTIEVTNKAKKDSVSFNNGSQYQISNIKSGLNQGLYTVIIKTVSGCVSNAVLVTIQSVVNVPANPQVQIIQPTCFIPTGTITITNKSALDSVSFNNGLNYQISDMKSGLSPATYNIKIKNTAGCMSNVVQSVINGAPGAISAPALSITQPTCTILTGSITITNKAAADSASFDNGLTYQIGNSKANLNPGTYLVKLKSPAGCVSVPGSGIINQYVPLQVSITNLDSAYYRNTLAFKMTGSPGGGVFKIDGNSPSLDKFDPTTLSMGNHTVTYVVTQNGCSNIFTRQVRIKSFTLEGEASQCYAIQDSLYPTLYAGVLDGSLSSNTAIIQQFYLDSTYQKWIVTDVNGYKRIRNNKSGLYLKVLSNGNVVQGAWDTISAEWVLVPVGSLNSFSVFSRLKEQYLTLGKKNSFALGSISGGTRPGSDQIFKFKPVNCGTTLSFTSTTEVLESRENIVLHNELLSIDLYPNPNQGLFTLKFHYLDLNQKTVLTIYSILGQKILEQKIEDHSPIKIQLSGNVISNGMYIVKLKSGNNIVLKSFLIRN